jgi:hypothetical protein
MRHRAHRKGGRQTRGAGSLRRLHQPALGRAFRGLPLRSFLGLRRFRKLLEALVDGLYRRLQVSLALQEFLLQLVPLWVGHRLEVDVS